jgi:hypothetical protein
VSEQPKDRRREFLERLKYVLGEERWLKFVAMAESGELDKHRRQFFEKLNKEEFEQCMKGFEFKSEFPKYYN